MKKTIILIMFIALGLSSAVAHDYAKYDIVIDHPWARPTFSAVVPAAVYFDIVNKGETPDRLISASTERAQAVELHVTETDENGIAKMRMLKDGIGAPGDETTSMETGAYHVMLIGLDKKLEVGEEFVMALEFEKAGKFDVVIKVEDRASKAPQDHHNHH